METMPGVDGAAIAPRVRERSDLDALPDSWVDSRVLLAACGEQLRNRQLECQKYAHQYGIDVPEEDQWTWPG